MQPQASRISVVRAGPNGDSPKCDFGLAAIASYWQLLAAIVSFGQVLDF